MNLIPDSINGRINRSAIYNCGICNVVLNLKIYLDIDKVSLSCKHCHFIAEYYFNINKGRYFWGGIFFSKYRIVRRTDSLNVYSYTLKYKSESLKIQDLNIETIKQLEKLLLL